MKDHVDILISKWKKECPEHDLSAVEVIGRAGRIMAYVDRALEAKFAEFGMSRASFDVLATLRRSGPPYRLLQRDLMQHLMRTSGSMSIRIDSLEREELVKREQDQDDRRATYVVLTLKGSKLLDGAIPEHLANESALLAGLTLGERTELVSILKKWLASLEEDNTKGVKRVHLGLVFLSARASLLKRRAVGLPDSAGLLIHSVEEGSRSAAAGLRKGDLITGVEGMPVSSSSSLDKALSKPRPSYKEIRVLRGAKTLSVKVDCRERD